MIEAASVSASEDSNQADAVTEHVQALSTFDYTSLGDTTSELVQQRTTELRSLIRQSAEDLITIGQKLLEVKNCFGHGQFGAWLEREFTWSQDTAENFMRVARRFGDFRNASEIPPSILYVLAAPSTPQSAVEETISRRKQGEVLSVKDVKRIVREHKTAVPSCRTLADKPTTSSQDLDDSGRASLCPVTDCGFHFLEETTQHCFDCGEHHSNADACPHSADIDSVAYFPITSGSLVDELIESATHSGTAPEASRQVEAYNLAVDLTQYVDLNPEDLAAICNQPDVAGMLAPVLHQVADLLHHLADALQEQAAE